ncbi:caspase domain-containing protein [Xylaria scruposa]|nr:caspase domain-containing protein [Xylaria scruposa]
MTIYLQDNDDPQKWAVLIAVNFYMPGKVRHPVYAGSLRGCVNDVEIAEHYLINHQHVDPQRILKLTASFPTAIDSDRPAEPKEQWPTYENIKLALERVTGDAKRGDIVYIHYSGHGGRAVTIVPNLKPGNSALLHRPGIDEALIPTDFNQGGRYLRDVELACLLKVMVNKGLHVTVVLDNCHSGGMGRDGAELLQGPTIRSIQGTDADGVDWVKLNTDKSDIPQSELESTAMIGTWQRNSTAGPSPQGWVMITACQPHEKTGEMTFKFPRFGFKIMGYLTYVWYESLLNAPGNIAYQALFRRARERMKEVQPQVTPVIMGNVGQQMFLNVATEVTHTISVSNLPAQRLLLQGGQAHGICEGDVFGIFSWDVSRIDISSPWLATAKVQVVRDTEAEAVPQLKAGEEVPVGSHAVLLRRTLPRVTFQLEFMPCPDAAGAEKLKHDLLRAIDLSKLNLTAQILIGSTRHNNAHGDGRNFWYTVTVDPDGKYLLHEPNDLSRTTLPASDSPESLLGLLDHMGIYYHYRALQGPSSASIRFTFEPLLDSQSFRYIAEENVVKIVEGNNLKLRFLNETNDFLYISVFYFSSLYGIHRVYPHPQIGDYEEVDWRHEREFTIRPKFQETIYKQPFVVETLKIFVTTKPTSFRAMEEVMDLDIKSGASGKWISGGKLQQNLRDILETFDSPQEGIREVSCSASGDSESLVRRSLVLADVNGGTNKGWNTKDITFCIYPPGCDEQTVGGPMEQA